MARILIGKEWYYGLSSTAYFEVEYENLILSRAAELFPQHHAVPFKKLVESEGGRAIADLALIEKEYRKWWVIEVELAHHSLFGHVVPQVNVLSNANYGEEVAIYLAGQSPQLDANSVRVMMKGHQPEVFVVVNQPVPGWISPLSVYGVRVAVIEVFRSDRNRHVLRINGEYPEPPGDSVSVLRSDPALPRLMMVDSPASLPGTSGDRIQIEYQGNVTEWTRIDARNRVWLAPVKDNPLSTNVKYELIKTTDGKLHVQ